METAAADAKDPFEDVIAGLKEKDPDVHVERLTTEMRDGTIVRGLATMPSPQQWTMVKVRGADTDVAQRVGAHRLCCNLTVKAYQVGDGDLVVAKTQDGAALTQLVKAYPAIVDIWGGEIAEMAGAVRGTIREKA